MVSSCLIKHWSRCCCEGILQIRFTFTASLNRLPMILWVGLIQSVVAFRAKTGVSWGRRNSVIGIIPEFPACQPALQILELPASIITGANSFKWIFHSSILCLSVSFILCLSVSSLSLSLSEYMYSIDSISMVLKDKLRHIKNLSLFE